MPIKTRRWNDPREPDDGLRILVTRFRPRGVPKRDEPWDLWRPELGPSRALLDDFHGKRGAPIGFEAYTPRYLAEMRDQPEAIARLAARVTAGATITLLCSSACTDPARCHRTLLAGLIEAAVRGSPLAIQP